MYPPFFESASRISSWGIYLSVSRLSGIRAIDYLMTSQGIETRQATALSDMNKQIEELLLSQNQQTEAIRKELSGEISELRNMMEKYFANTPPPSTN